MTLAVELDSLDPACSEHLPVSALLENDSVPVRRTADGVLVATALPAADRWRLDAWFPGENLMFSPVGAAPLAGGWGATAVIVLIGASFCACVLFKLVLATSSKGHRAIKSRYSQLADEDLPCYTIIVPAYHEEEVIGPTIQWIANVGFIQLAEAVLREMAPPIASPDLLILAYALPDLHPLKSTTTYLNYLLGGESRSFAVAEQGLRAPFTALRIADAYVRAVRYANLALFICDQTTLPYYDPVVHDTPLADGALALGCAEATRDYLAMHRSRLAKADHSEVDGVADRIAAVRALLHRVAADLDHDHGDPHRISAVKAQAAQVAEDMTMLAARLLGPASLIEHPWLEKTCRDVRAFDIMEGPANLHRLAVFQGLRKATNLPGGGNVARH
jgi:hypothetical protein